MFIQYFSFHFLSNAQRMQNIKTTTIDIMVPCIQYSPSEGAFDKVMFFLFLDTEPSKNIAIYMILGKFKTKGYRPQNYKHRLCCPSRVSSNRRTHRGQQQVEVVIYQSTDRLSRMENKNSSKVSYSIPAGQQDMHAKDKSIHETGDAVIDGFKSFVST